MSKLLFPLTYLYSALSALDRNITNPVKLARPVISVGNITWGGTGKTPVVMALAEEMISAGLKPAVLTRGYARKGGGRNSVLVSDGVKLLSTPQETGDEPYLLAEKLHGAAVVSGPDRQASAELIERTFKPDLFILDDGFQHWKIKRDIDIVCVNALNPFGNGALIPAGSLREMPEALKRADDVIITNSDSIDQAALERLDARIRDISGKRPSAVRYTVSAVRNLLTGETLKAPFFGQRPVTALSAIGENSGFRYMLERNGIPVLKHFTFKDHHWYGLDEIKLALAAGTAVLTTEKDAVRIKPLLASPGATGDENLYVVCVKAEFTQGENNWSSYAERIKRYL